MKTCPLPNCNKEYKRNFTQHCKIHHKDLTKADIKPFLYNRQKGGKWQKYQCKICKNYFSRTYLYTHVKKIHHLARGTEEYSNAISRKNDTTDAGVTTEINQQVNVSQSNEDSVLELEGTSSQSDSDTRNILEQIKDFKQRLNVLSESQLQTICIAFADKLKNKERIPIPDIKNFYNDFTNDFRDVDFDRLKDKIRAVSSFFNKC